MGPLEGGTLVTIEGSNLGLREEDVRDNVFIGDVPCRVHEYHVSVRITCVTGPAPLRHGSPDAADLQFPVRVTTPAGTTQSTVKFTYTNVSVTGVWPPRGPLSGGTVLSVSGRFLNVGSHVAATLDDLPCVVNKTQSSSHRLVCITSRAAGAHEGGGEAARAVRTLVVTVDGARRTLAAPYTYTPDPQVFELKPLRSPWGGGRLVTVHGSNLDAIQAPRITVNLFEKVLNSSACRVLSPGQMECPSPPLDRDAVLAILEAHDSLRRRRRSRSRRSHKAQRSPRRRDHDGDEVGVDVGFVMDGVLSVLHLRKHFPGVRSRLVYLADPLYYTFSHGVKLYKGDTLVVEGEHINDAADESDVRVTIGSAVCNVTSLAATQLVCTPPEDQPAPTDERGVSTPSAAARGGARGPVPALPAGRPALRAAPALPAHARGHRGAGRRRAVPRAGVLRGAGRVPAQVLAGGARLQAHAAADGQPREPRAHRVQASLRRATDRHDRPHRRPGVFGDPDTWTTAPTS
ncbi:Plexin-B [Penaeus vannamei]|uniref:Plexin-B n=1 Tax=Penaeus vannamei TaxID=6689 RepID=A0A3R7Q833_PENVA|nr:Plexin-B [Penaeus vannamei]